MSTAPGRSPLQNRSEMGLSVKSVSGEDPMKMFKILEAIQKGDLATLSAILPTYRGSNYGNMPTTPGGSISSNHSLELHHGSQTTPIHLAAQNGQYTVFEHVLNLLPQVDLNARDNHGSTALHIAASMGRLDIVKLLLTKEAINDGILDYKDKSPLDVAATPEIRVVLNAHRSEYLLNATTLMHRYAENGDLRGLQSLFNDSKAAFVLSISHQNTETGSTLLHSAAKRKDMAMVQWCLDQGIDPHLRDKKGKTAADVAKDSKIKTLLKEARSQDMPIQLSITSPGQAPKLQGTLFKWTNYASGYKARWFVLENGILSYFHNQEDAGNACRGSINMRIAKLWIDSADKQRFDIIGKGSVRYHLKAGHVNEAKRWILALTQTKQWIEETSGDSKLPRASIADSVSVRSSLNLYATLGSDAITSSSSAASTLSRGRAPGSFVGGIDEAGSFNSEARPRSRSTSPSIDDQNTLPHQESFPATVNYLQNQIQLQTEMVDNLVRLHRASELPEDSAAMRFSLGAAEASSSMSTSLRTLLKMVQDRENYWKKILEQESQKRELWESSLKTLSEEQLEMQRLLKKAEDNNKRMKKSRSMRSAKTSGASTPVLAPAMTMIAGAEAIANQSTSTSAPELALTSETATKATPAITIDGASATATPGAPASAPIREVFEVHAPVAAQFPPSTVNIAPVEQQIADSETDYGSEDDESGDEFFDAVGDDDVKGLDDLRNDKDLLPTPPTVPVTVTAPVSSSGSSASVVTSATPTTASTSTGSNEIVPAGGSYISPSFKGYTAKLRDRLPTPQTSLRPDVSLWAILKNSIGKDLSKITLPVYFNEPTSMLQRMAEDAEYIQLLDLAARQRNATERILYVAAFAMSNYSSTIGRVAKPFNPLLGETFEYCREDRQFRYVSEQVSHHPPISACHCDSPNYNFFAEVDVKSKFWGKSFEVMPKGTSHVELKVPKQYAVMSTSLLTDPDDESKFVEHYSWKKVTTCVQNLIVGTPWIDSYGDMIITNHRTGEVCKMTFKARGWRGKDAYEIRGYAQDSTGKEVWEVAGRWNERLVARRSGQNHAGDLGSDAVAAQASGLNDENPNGSPARGKSSSSVAVNPRQVVLLWKRDQVPEGTPFNLTPFAMTLNDLSPELRKHLCPTDSRLRPDQRAMENAQFDLANTEKQRLEEKQRAKRKLLPPGHEVEPRWFKRNPGEEGGWAFVGKRPPVELQGSAKTDGERLGYWDERKRCGATNERPQQLKWDITDDDIF